MSQPRPLSSDFPFQQVEAQWRQAWRQAGAFRARDQDALPPWCLILPPPNLTGPLHLGHGLSYTLQDVLTRFRRMDGYDPRWIPGTDHAGLAFQAQVSRLAPQDVSPPTPEAPERLQARGWALRDARWRQVREELQQLGASCDWDKECFSLDDGAGLAVRSAFVKLFQQGLLRKRATQTPFCPACQSVLDAVEVRGQGLGTVCPFCEGPLEQAESAQWFLELHQPGQAVARLVEEGRLRLEPAGLRDSLPSSLRALGSWCISRQGWWGHTLPVYGCEACGEELVSLEAPLGCARCGGGVHPSTDVLDPWFGAALWPLITLGWPVHSLDLERYYPAALLLTGPDVLEVWVERLLVLGYQLTGELPVRGLYLHPLLLDSEGRKLGRALGPGLCETLSTRGADVTRFALASLAASQASTPLPTGIFEASRTLVSRLWSLGQHAGQAIESLALDDETLPSEAFSLPDRWIIQCCRRAVEEVRGALEDWRLQDAALVLHRFVGEEICQTYLQAVLPALDGQPEGGTRGGACFTLLEVLDVALRLLHPFMPFITEELWQRLPVSDGPLALARFPSQTLLSPDESALLEMEQLLAVVAEIRRLGQGLPSGVEGWLYSAAADERALLEEYPLLLGRLGGIPVRVGRPGLERPEATAAGLAGAVDVLLVRT